MTNSERYPEAWDIFVKAARRHNDNSKDKRYSIRNPLFNDKVVFIYSHCPGILFQLFIRAYYSEENTNKSEKEIFCDKLVWLERMENKKPSNYKRYVFPY